PHRGDRLPARPSRRAHARHRPGVGQVHLRVQREPGVLGAAVRQHGAVALGAAARVPLQVLSTRDTEKRNGRGMPRPFPLVRPVALESVAEKQRQRRQEEMDMTHSPRPEATLPTVDARVYPRGGLDILSRDEVARLKDASSGGLHDLLRRCALAVLTSGSANDDPRAAQEMYPDFDIQVLQQDRGLRIELRNAPAMAFVDGEIIRGVAELLFATVRDLAYMAIELGPDGGSDPDSSPGITNAVFGQLRNARLLHPRDPTLVVCWGGHSISRVEYEYTKLVGYELGLRGLDICTGCGPGAM